METELKERLKTKILGLASSAWEGKPLWTAVEAWLSNFNGQVGPIEKEHLHALYLLGQFMYFGSAEMRELLRALYRDLFQYSILEKIRKTNDDTKDYDFIKAEFHRELMATRFFGVGNPSESGVHLLYYFRQENGLPKDLFLETHRIYSRHLQGQEVKTQLRFPEVKRYVFIDDICGSGHQASSYSQDLLAELLRLNPEAEPAYYALFATQAGLKYIRENTCFGARCGSVYELDSSYRLLSEESRYFLDTPPGIEKEFMSEFVTHYGNLLSSDDPLGYNNGQLLLGFNHNTPDNCLPIIWFNEENGYPWVPIFKRYPKIYGGVY